MPSEALPAGALLRRGCFRRVWMGRIEAACLTGCLKLPESGRQLKKNPDARKSKGTRREYNVRRDDEL